MSLPCVLDDYDLAGFLKVATDFGVNRYGFVITPNVDHLIRYHDDAKYRAVYSDASYVLLDSRFLAHMFRLAKGLRVPVCTGSDLTARLFGQVIAPDDCVILIGGSNAQVEILSQRYGLRQIKHYNPPMGFINDPREVEACLQFIEANSPFRFCFLGVGAPQQEYLAQMLKQRGVARGMALCVGASVNFLTGVERRAPRWMQRLGMEWLYRLMQDPRRLAKRYLIRGLRVFPLFPLTEFLMRPRAGSPPSRPVVGLTQTTPIAERE